MALWLKLILICLGILIAGITAAVLIGTGAWHRSSSALISTIIEETPSSGERIIGSADYSSLPGPVAKYFRLVLKNNQPLIRSARLRQEGEIRIGTSEDDWHPFTAEQFFSALQPGFIWDAKVSMAPLMNARVRDGYVLGKGSMFGKLVSLITIINEHDKPELHAAALQRYLAEAVWLPTALLPENGVQWTAVDLRSALAEIEDSGTKVSMEFRFNNRGEIESVYSVGRGREVNGKYELTPWEGRFRNYQERGGMKIPLEGEVEWILPEGKLTYWKGKITQAEYVFD